MLAFLELRIDIVVLCHLLNVAMEHRTVYKTIQVVSLVFVNESIYLRFVYFFKALLNLVLFKRMDYYLNKELFHSVADNNGKIY
jgi:hypothetical protein